MGLQQRCDDADGPPDAVPELDGRLGGLASLLDGGADRT
jgi:hypothetical protein